MLAPGTVLADKYLVDRVIGQGGMATVVSARHLHLNETVAIKMLLPELAQDPTIVERFMREARAAVRLKGEHVTRVLDVGLLPWGAPFMVMELLIGYDVGELLKSRNVLSSHEAVDIILQVCEALAEAHVGGIVHRDIKPSNLFITTRPDGSPLVKVLDFGISKVGWDNHVSNLTQNAIVGTPSYMSPEQLRGLPSVDGRSDIWSLGIVLYRLLDGQRPFKADSMSALAIQCATEPTPNFTMLVPEGLANIVFRCLEKDPTARFQSVAELAYALAPFAGDKRAATIVTERTQNILRWTPPPPAPLPHHGPRPHGEPTTLGSSVAQIYPTYPIPQQPRGASRSWLIATVAFGIVGGVIAAVTIAGRGDKAADSSTVQPAAPPVVQPIETPKAEPAPEPAKVEPPPAPAVEAKPEPKVEEPKVEEPKVEAKVEPKVVKPKTEAKVEPKRRGDKKPKPEVKPVETKPTVVETKPEPKPEPKKTNPLDTRM